MPTEEKARWCPGSCLFINRQKATPDSFLGSLPEGNPDGSIESLGAGRKLGWPCERSQIPGWNLGIDFQCPEREIRKREGEKGKLLTQATEHCYPGLKTPAKAEEQVSHWDCQILKVQAAAEALDSSSAVIRTVGPHHTSEAYRPCCRGMPEQARATHGTRSQNANFTLAAGAWSCW